MKSETVRMQQYGHFSDVINIYIYTQPFRYCIYV